jgi:hypothetical protein
LPSPTTRDDNLPAWQALVAWQEDSRYKLASHWCLEEADPQLFLPLTEPTIDQVEFQLYFGRGISFTQRMTLDLSGT